MKAKPAPGTRVRYGSYFRRCTGVTQCTFTVVECKDDCNLCPNGRHVAVDRPGIYGGDTSHVCYVHLEECK